MRADILKLIQANPRITAKQLAAMADCPPLTAKRRIFYVRRIERLTGVPVSEWRLTRSGVCQTCAAPLTMPTIGSPPKYCVSCRKARDLAAKARFRQKQYDKKRVDRLAKRASVMVDGVMIAQDRIDKATAYFQTSTTPTKDGFASYMELGPLIASFLYPHMKKLAIRNAMP